MSFDAVGTPTGALVLAQLASGRTRCRSDGSERYHRPGDVYLTAQPDHPFRARLEDAEAGLVVIDPALLSQVADSGSRRARHPVRLTGYEPVSAQAGQTWNRTYAYICDTILAGPEEGRQPLITAMAARLLVAAVLAVFPNNALTDPTIEDRHDGHSATLRRAVAFVEEHAHEDVSIADIAAAASVTIRAVQLAFRRHLGITPMAYLRRVRLDHAHRELLSADPARVQVTQVAYRWGFPSPARFAAYYRATYGELPSHTLRS